MQPTTSRDFLKAAAQRLMAAEFLAGAGKTLDSLYIGGYTIECSLKALILELTPEHDKPDKLRRISSGATMHKFETLIQELRSLRTTLPIRLARRLRRSDWSTELRYQTGRLDAGETTAFLKTAKEIYDWVGGQLP